MFTGFQEEQTIKIEQTHPLYPKEWLELPDAPEAVYAVGDITLLKQRKLTVVGSRRTPINAVRLGKQMAQSLCDAFVLVTGTADGGDSAAIEGALCGSGKIICVLAGGFSALPKTNLELLYKVSQKGLLLSPYSFETPVREYSYEYRNKLLAKMSEGTLVLGAAKKSGALITARYARRFKKALFAIPYSPGVTAGEGCNAIIKAGGVLTESEADVFKYFDLTPNESKKTLALTEEETRIYQALKDKSEAHASELAAELKIPVFKLLAKLSALEVKGVVANLGGNRYTIV